MNCWLPDHESVVVKRSVSVEYPYIVDAVIHESGGEDLSSSCWLNVYCGTERLTILEYGVLVHINVRFSWATDGSC